MKWIKKFNESIEEDYDLIDDLFQSIADEWNMEKISQEFDLDDDWLYTIELNNGEKLIIYEIITSSPNKVVIAIYYNKYKIDEIKMKRDMEKFQKRAESFFFDTSIETNGIYSEFPNISSYHIKLSK